MKYHFSYTFSIYSGSRKESTSSKYLQFPALQPEIKTDTQKKTPEKTPYNL